MAIIAHSTSERSPSWISRTLRYFIMLLIGFLLGFVPMWVRSGDSATALSEAANRADRTRTENALALAAAAHGLELAGMQNMLASAAIDAQRGDYESARQAASSFFTALRAETDKGTGSILSPAQTEAAQPLFMLQDEVITLLARNDPAAAARFSELYMAFRELMSE